tara:strand:- start:643 stop:1020 length:378 start_codon:yes stop_codon:yes gene_type:complete
MVDNAKNNKLILSPIGGAKWVVVKAVYYHLAGYVFCIPKGFIFDGASIPKVLRSFVNKDGLWKSSLLHDFLYRTQPVSRKIADQLFLLQMKIDGVGWIKRHTVYRGLRLGGWVTFNAHKAKLATN